MNMIKKDELSLIETKIASLIKNNRKAWKLSYSLIRNVEDNRMWALAGFHSFSSWVRHMAEDHSISEVFVWKILSAGDTYKRYQESAKQNGINAEPLSECRLAMDTIISINKMGQGNDKLTYDLICFANQNKVTRRNVREAWAKTRIEIERSGFSAVRSNGYMDYNTMPYSINPVKILKETVYHSSASNTATDKDILYIVHKYLGANVHKSTLENALRDYVALL